MSHFHREIHQDRIKNLRNRVKSLILGERVVLSAECAKTKLPVPYAERERLEYRPIGEGEVWGEAWDSAWLRLRGTVPKEWAGSYVVARIDLSGEVLVFDAEGCPSVGLTNGSVFDADYNKDILHLLPECRGGESVDLWVEAAANHLFGLHRDDPERLDDPKKLHGHLKPEVHAIRLHRFDAEMWHLWIELDVLIDLYENLSKDSLRRERLLRGLDRAADAFSKEGAKAARAVLAEHLAVQSDPVSLELTGVGHAHIDTGWLWPVRESIRKCARTFSSQIGLIERYPGYVFGASQAQHYEFVKEHYPALYAKIKKAVADGTWEIQGGMWVEADCNLISGESMVRQLVHGKHFFKREFGVEVKNLWLPDVFGYSANLPQILTKSGCDYFLTQKLGWSKYNSFPHTTFMWRGIDGSEVLTHFPPESNYNAPVKPHALIGGERNYKERAILNEGVSVFGIGDGGGGPKEEYLERALLLKDLNGVPRLRLGAAQPVFERLALQRAELDTWVGELYLEAHRGTLTTQAAVKRLNRRLEEALRATEMLCAAAALQGYPQSELNAVWKKLLINQFHDIIPGSSIHLVYETTVPELEQGLATCANLAALSASRIGRADAGATTLFNPSSTPYKGAVELPAGLAVSAACAQVEGDVLVVDVELAGQSFATLRQGVKPNVSSFAQSENLVLENDLVRYELDKDLKVIAALDKQQGRAILAAGETGNLLSLYEDRPHAWDAWDVDEYYPNELIAQAKAEGPVERLDGPVRSGLRARLSVGGSSLTLTAWLGRSSKRLDFVADVDWRENRRMLRVSFPTTIHAPEASFEIQYGYVKRPSHTNTSWDAARFEVVGHRFADLSEPDYGVALLNDCKYGYKVRDHVLDLNLLRAPMDPDPIADRGQHSIRWALLPHAGDLAHSDVFAEAAMLNQGLVVLPSIDAAGATLPVRLEGEGIELSVLKKAEEQDCLVVRVVERCGTRTRGRLVARDAKARFVPTDLVEWRDDDQAASHGSVTLDLAPFEIRTYKLEGTG